MPLNNKILKRIRHFTAERDVDLSADGHVDIKGVVYIKIQQNKQTIYSSNLLIDQ